MFQKLNFKDYHYWITIIRSTFDVHKCLSIVLETEVDPILVNEIIIILRFRTCLYIKL